MIPSLTSRLESLEERVAALEAGSVEESTESSGRSGTVGYRGVVDLAGEVHWQIEYDARALLDIDPEPLALVLSTLGHPTRLAIVRRLLQGEASSTDLQEWLGEVSTGQLYHHLGALAAAHLIGKGGRNNYRIAAPAVVPVLVLMLASADLSGQLGT